MTRPDLDALAALLDKATPGHHPLSTAESAAHHMANAKDEIVRALPALLAYVRELERERDDAREWAANNRCDLNKAGKTILDFYALWLQQARDEKRAAAIRQLAETLK